uniref:Uncharacterized protein n=1 Tax=Anguilla anguilla TaxID=7936 RepID=A0A0E9V9F0_ANGAN
MYTHTHTHSNVALITLYMCTEQSSQCMQHH